MNNDLLHILEGVKRGDVRSFELLYDLYVGKVLNYTKKIVSNKDLSEDITQSCFVMIWEHRETIDTTKSFNSYILTIAKNIVYDEMRKALLKERYAHKVAIESAGYSDETIEEIGKDLLQEHVDQIVEKMPTSMRRIYKLNSHEGMTAKEIAHALSLSIKSVETQILRAKKVLRANLSHFLSLFLIFF